MDSRRAKISNQSNFKSGQIVKCRDDAARVIKPTSEDSFIVLLTSTSTEVEVTKDEIQELECLSQCDDKFKIIEDSIKKQNQSSPEADEEARAIHMVISQYKAREINLHTATSMLRCSRATFFRKCKKYDSEIGPATLLRGKGGRITGTRTIPELVEKAIQEAIKTTYKGKAATYSKVYQETLNLCIERGLDKPSRGTVVNRLKLISNKELHRKKHGGESAREKFSPKPGKIVTEAPLEVWQMDHTLMDIIVCDEISREPIGRPWLTIIIDIHTRVIAGYYIALHAPSTLSVATALSFARMPKTQYLKNIGCGDVNYQIYGVPKALHLDNAKEFKSHALLKACAKHDIKLKWRPIGQKHHGGHVERLIGTLMVGYVHLLPGTTYSNTQKRKGYDSEKAATLSYKELNVHFARHVAIYHATIHRGLKKAPGVAWQEQDPNLNTTVPTQSELFGFKLDFMPQTERAISTKGIQLFGVFYYSPAIDEYIGSKKVIVKYDPYSIRKIWIYVDHKYIEVPYSDITNDDSTLEQHSIKRKRQSKNSTNEWISEDEKVRLVRENQRLVSQATNDTKKQKKLKAALTEYGDYTQSLFPYQEKPESIGKADVNYNVKPPVFSSDD